MQSDRNLMFVSPISVAIAAIVPGHLIGCGGADPHNSLTSTSSTSLEHFPHKTEKMHNISDKAAAFHPHKHKS